ncbi:MAG: hypothetical protein AB7D29_10550 [Campylobacterales bacterium]
MKLVFIHGWSVTSLSTYGELPEAVQTQASLVGLEVEIENIYLGEYISFHDEVMLDDIARAFDKARQDKLGNELFACITHSTGGPVVRLWIELFFKNNLSACPLTHLVMLAPANHGSSLAILGKGRLSRIKAWWDGVEPGVGVLNWLQLGSNGQWSLNDSWLEYKYNNDTFFPFVLCGETIDNHFYDFLNPYLVEAGSDGVIRLAGANLNYTVISLVQNCNAEPIDAVVDGTSIKAFPLELKGDIKTPQKCAFEVIADASHSGDKIGIMASVKKESNKPVVESIIGALKVTKAEEYELISQNMSKKTTEIQKADRYVMLVFEVKDNYGNLVNDFDMLLLAGNDYKPSELPKGFFVDRQKNSMSGRLVYYINFDKIKEIKDGKIGIRIIARPDEGFSHYAPAEFRLDGLVLDKLLKPNQTTMIDVTLIRRIAENTFVLEKLDGHVDEAFKDRKPGQKII